MAYSGYGQDPDFMKQQAATDAAKKQGVIKLIKYGAIVVGILIALAIQPFTYENIDAGNTGIKLNLYGTDRGVDNVTIVTGRVWYNTWTTRVVEFPTFMQNVDYDAFIVNTKDAAEFHVDPKLSYHVNAVFAPRIYKSYRKTLKEIEQQSIRNSVYEAYRIAANSFSSDSVMSHRQVFDAKVESILRKSLEKDGFVFESLTSKLDPPTSLREMINAKNASIQARLKADNEALQAESEGKVLKARADAEATATLVKAKAEAEANRLRQVTLTPLLLQQQWIQKWDGTLSTTSLGGSTPVMVNLK